MSVCRIAVHEQRTTFNEQHVLMNINRHNYEEFFLLYVDNELSAADRKAVDVFVQQNPDLQGELLLLLQTVIKADEDVLEKKNWLYREEEISVLQENILQYADDELTPADKKSIEVLLATDKLAMAEWNILQQTKLEPDASIVFADKQSLYRTAGGRVVSFAWRRVAAAAVLLGLLLWAGVSVYKTNFKTTTGDGELVDNNKVKAGQQKTEEPVNTTEVSSKPEEKETAQNNNEATNSNKGPLQKTEVNKQPVYKTNALNKVEPKENITTQNNSTKKPDNNLPKPYFENINKATSNETTAASVIPENNKISKVSGNNTEVVKTNMNEINNNSIAIDLNKSKADQSTKAILAVNNKNPDENKNSRYLEVDDNKEKRTALSGFLRKAKRMIERTTNIKTGDGIKVAGFEIALK